MASLVIRRCVGVVLAIAGLLMVVVAGQSPAQAQGATAAAQDGGQAVYEASCAGCHADDGTGVSGLGRPLTGIAAQGDAATHIASVTDGKGAMPAFGARLSADEIEQAVTYARETFVEEAADAADEEAEEAEETVDAEETEEAEEAADDAGDDAALAETGIEATGLAVIGFTLLAGGIQLVAFSKRRN